MTLPLLDQLIFNNTNTFSASLLNDSSNASKLIGNGNYTWHAKYTINNFLKKKY